MLLGVSEYLDYLVSVHEAWELTMGIIDLKIIKKLIEVSGKFL